MSVHCSHGPCQIVDSAGHAITCPEVLDRHAEAKIDQVGGYLPAEKWWREGCAKGVVSTRAKPGAEFVPLGRRA